MKRHWLRTIIRMLNLLEEQLGEFRVKCGTHDDDRFRRVHQYLKGAARELNDVYDELQVDEK